MSARPTATTFTALAATALLALPAAAQEPTRDHLVIATQFVPDILDGQQSTSGYPLSHELIAQPLMRYDSDAGVFVPDLLESFTVSEDGTVMTMVLPAGRTFTSGNPIDAAALAATIQRFIDEGPYGTDYDGVSALNVIDEVTLEVLNDNGFNLMYPNFVTSFGAAWDTVAAAEAGNESFASNPVAGGPFMIAGPWSPGLDLELVRNDGYATSMPMVENKGPAHLASVTTRFITDAQTRANELEAGSVDIAFGLPAAALSYMADDPAYTIVEVVLPGMNGLTLNVRRAPFDNIAVRRAVAMAVDRDQIALALGGAAVPESAFVTPTMIGYTEAARAYMAELYPTEMAAAQALLAEAGWTDSDGDGVLDKDGEALAAKLLIDSGSALATGAAPVIQAQLKAMGMDLTIAQVDLTTQYEILDAGNFDVSISGYIWSDPDILTYRFAEGSSQSGYVTEAMDAALTEARSIADPQARAAAYLEIQKMLMDDVPSVPLMSETLIIGMRSWVQGAQVLAPDRLILNDVMILE